MESDFIFSSSKASAHQLSGTPYCLAYSLIHLKKIYEETIHNQQGDLIKSLYENNEPIAEAAKTILNEIAEITWSCSSHTAGYVPLYAIGLGAENFQGKLDNTDVPLLIARIAGYE